eukprot:912083-Pleurochrysis_carterae.AAC.1
MCIRDSLVAAACHKFDTQPLSQNGVLLTICCTSLLRQSCVSRCLIVLSALPRSVGQIGQCPLHAGFGCFPLKMPRCFSLQMAETRCVARGEIAPKQAAGAISHARVPERTGARAARSKGVHASELRLNENALSGYF